MFTLVPSIQLLALIPSHYLEKFPIDQFNISINKFLPPLFSDSLTMTGKILVKRLNEMAKIPTRGSKFAAGYDLYSAGDYKIMAGGKEMVETGLQISVPPGTYGRIAPRSGLAWKHSIDVGAGVIDYDYRGPVNVILFNFGKNDFEIKRGDRIAQLICEKIEYPDMEEVQDLEATERGTNGFGSTGV